jgi:hypothetical protein
MALAHLRDEHVARISEVFPRNREARSQLKEHVGELCPY